MRTPHLLATLLLLPVSATAWAQVNVLPVEPVLPPAPGAGDPGATPPGAVAPQSPQTPPSTPGFQSRVTGHKPSPEWTQDRSFASTRFWLLDPGKVSLETWSFARIYPSINGLQDKTSFRFYQEVAIGIYPHLQLDLYGEFHIDAQTDVTTGKDNASYYPSLEGMKVELRIALPDSYGVMPLNPVIYLEYQAYLKDPSRFEIRLLLGGAANRWLFLAANPYFELNITESDKTFDDGTTKKVFLMDAEVGTTLGAGFKITDWFNLSLQAKIGGDMLGDSNNRFHFVAWAGPGFIIKPLPRPFQQYLKIIGVALFLLPGSDTNGRDSTDGCTMAASSGCYGRPQQYEPTLILGSQF